MEEIIEELNTHHFVRLPEGFQPSEKTWAAHMNVARLLMMRWTLRIVFVLCIFSMGIGSTALLGADGTFAMLSGMLLGTYIYHWCWYDGKMVEVVMNYDVFVDWISRLGTIQ